ncbi:YqiA/YcfP family alpha/beta fold hydrolase [Thermodesulfobacteriota bacterium]
MQLCFLHGLESSPQGTKAKLLKKRYPQCLIPFLPPDIHERVRIVEQEVSEPVLTVGSSLGGLTAVMFAMKHPEMFKAMVLLAPAVGCSDVSLFAEERQRIFPSLYVPQGIPTIIIAGIRDALIPLPAIREMIQRSPDPEQIQLYEVDDEHDLNQSLEFMMQKIEQIRTKIA